MKYNIRDKSIVIFGFGAQGRAQASNLRDSGLNVPICLPESSSSIADVSSQGFSLITDPATAARKAEIAVFLIPDTAQKNLYKEIKDQLPKNAAIIFAHGFSIHYKEIVPNEDLDIILVAPLGHASALRQHYLDKSGLPVMIAVDQNVTGLAWKIARTYARALGATDEKIIESTFAEETETDLFVEQSLICGGVFSLITAAFDTLVENGYSPEVAYYCCLKETEIMSRLFSQHGIHGTFKIVSDVAKFGALSRGPRVVGDNVKAEMQKILDEIKSGKFLKEFENESESDKKMQILAKHKLELMHRKLNRS